MPLIFASGLFAVLGQSVCKETSCLQKNKVPTSAWILTHIVHHRLICCCQIIQSGGGTGHACSLQGWPDPNLRGAADSLQLMRGQGPLRGSNAQGGWGRGQRGAQQG